MKTQEKKVVADAIAILDKQIQSEAFSVSNSKCALEFLRLKLEPSEREIFGVLFLDVQHKVIAFEELFLGTLDKAEVHPREVLKRTLLLNASAIILAHNHPSGSAEPSRADREVTEHLEKALKLIDVSLLDHFIIGKGTHVSFSERGLL